MPWPTTTELARLSLFIVALLTIQAMASPRVLENASNVALQGTITVIGRDQININAGNFGAAWHSVH
jgi:hypothetical protein